MSDPGDFIELTPGLAQTDLQEFFRRARAKSLCKVIWLTPEEREVWQERLAPGLELTDDELKAVFWTGSVSALQWAKSRQAFKARCAASPPFPTTSTHPPRTEREWNASYSAWREDVENGGW